MPDAEYVVVWNDTQEQIVKVKIEHQTYRVLSGKIRA